MHEQRAEQQQKSRPPQHQRRQPGRESEMQPRPIVIRENYRGSEKLAGRVALITGGDSGIGRAVAVHFAREGADVAIVYLDETDDAEETRRMVEQEGRECVTFQGDLGDPEFCREVIGKVTERFGQLDVLVNNAAEQHVQNDLTEISDEQLHRTFNTNFFPVIYLTRAALPKMKAGSCIINTGSVTSFHGSPPLMDYSATKGAIQAFTFSLAKSLAKRQIRVNGVAPGPIWTPLIPASFKAKQVEEFGSNTLMERTGQPSEVAPAYVYLASEDASYVTGQFIHVNGGSFIAP